MRYVKKPVVIDAIQWTGNNLKEIIDFIGLHESAKKWTWEEYEAVVKKEGLKIFTLEGTMMASVGDFIIKGVNGEVYPCKPNIFEKTYLVHQPKRKPLPDGELELTDEEKHEFSNKFLKHTNLIYFFMVIEDKIHMRFLNGIYDNVCDNYKALLWIAKKFQLTDEV